MKFSFNKLFADIERRQQERIKKAGKHKCIKILCGTVERVTGRNNKTLKRPVVIKRLFECKICGRDMP